jgi:hypothetical protein
VFNGILRLVWTYLYRCHEPGTTVTAKMENLLKHFFPLNRHTIVPHDERIEPLIYLVHFILTRNFDYGSEVCLELLQEKLVSSTQPGSSGPFLAPERMTVAVQAILLSIKLLEQEEPTPSWPSTSDFTTIPDSQDYPSSSNILPTELLRPNWTEFLDRCSAAICTVAVLCYHSVGRMSVLDDQWSTARLNPSYEETHTYVIRHHAEGSMAYPMNCIPQVNVLQLCYQSWPRCLHNSLPLDDALEMLVRGVTHVEPAIGKAAITALARFTADFEHNCALLSRLVSMMFSPQSINSEGSGLRLMVESSQLTELWSSAVDKWTEHIKQRRNDSFTETELESMSSKMDEIEAASLFMLCMVRRDVCKAGSKTLRLLHAIRDHLPLLSVSDTVETGSHAGATTTTLLDTLPPSLFDGSEDILSDTELDYLRKWKVAEKQSNLLDIAESSDVGDRTLWWKHVYPAVIQILVEKRSNSLSVLREKLVSAVSRYHPFVVQFSGVGTRGVPPRSASIGNRESSKLLMDKELAVVQWHAWAKILCITAEVPEARQGQSLPVRDHARGRSELNIEREGFVSSRDMFKYLSPFLDSDHKIFREAAVSCICSLPVYGYSQLLEDLSILASRQLYDDLRTKNSSLPNIGRARRQERFYTAVARIYYLTAQNMPRQRSSGKQTALTHILKYIRNMQTFLSSHENRDQFSLQRLRRYFCGILERFFDGLAVLADTDRFVPPGMYLSLYRLCEEWCQLGKQSEDVMQRLIFMQTACSRSFQDPGGQADSIKKFQIETKALSNAAVGAMASLIVRIDRSTAIPSNKLPLVESIFSSRSLSIWIPDRESYPGTDQTT